MQTGGFFDRAGEAVGSAIRAVIRFFELLFGDVFGAIDAFFDGLSRSLGISGSFFSIAILIIGLWLLWSGIRALLRGSLLGAIIWILLALLVLSWVMV